MQDKRDILKWNELYNLDKALVYLLNNNFVWQIFTFWTSKNCEVFVYKFVSV